MFFQTLRLSNANFTLLFFDLCSYLFQDQNTPHFIKEIHIEQKTVLFTFVIGHRTIGKAVELDKASEIIPVLLVLPFSLLSFNVPPCICLQ